MQSPAFAIDVKGGERAVKNVEEKSINSISNSEGFMTIFEEL
jgi:hypothetical protein